MTSGDELDPRHCFLVTWTPGYLPIGSFFPLEFFFIFLPLCPLLFSDYSSMTTSGQCLKRCPDICGIYRVSFSPSLLSSSTFSYSLYFILAPFYCWSRFFGLISSWLVPFSYLTTACWPRAVISLHFGNIQVKWKYSVYINDYQINQRKFTPLKMHIFS